MAWASRPAGDGLRVRLGLLTTSFPRHDGDGAGHFVRGFSETLCARGHRVDVLAPEPPAPATPPPFPGQTVDWVPYMRPRGWARTFYGAGAPDNLAHSMRARIGAPAFTAALWLRARARRSAWQAVVSHWALPCGWVASGLGLPHLCVVHSADMHLLARLPGARAFATAIATPRTRMWFVAPHLRDAFLGLLSRAHAERVRADCHTGPMGIDLPTTNPTRVPVGGRASSRAPITTLLCLARLVPVKGLDVLVRAVAGRRDLRLWLGGAGPERQRLSDLARSLGAQVELLGHVAGDRKAELLGAADVFVLPSRALPSGRSEGAPTAVLEAMAAGLPVVATRTGGIESLVTDGEHGLLCPPDDPRALMSAIDRLRGVDGPRAAMGRAAAAHARSFSWEALGPEIDALLSHA